MCDIYICMCVYACVHAACVDASTRRAHVHGCLCTCVRKRQYRHIERPGWFLLPVLMGLRR